MATLTTKPEATASSPSADVPDEPIFRLSVEQYHAMARAGILTDEDPVELLEGWLVQKMTKSRPHVIAADRVRRAVERLIPPAWHVASQDPVTSADSEPEPDLAVIRGSVDDYPDRHPGPGDVALIVEVADSSLHRDRGSKKRLYARAGFPVYWVVNLVDRQVELYTEPSGPRKKPDYRRQQVLGPAEELSLLLNGVEVGRIPVRELLP